jgi:hypothetical protein
VICFDDFREILATVDVVQEVPKVFAGEVTQSGYLKLQDTVDLKPIAVDEPQTRDRCMEFVDSDFLAVDSNFPRVLEIADYPQPIFVELGRHF